MNGLRFSEGLGAFGMSGIQGPGHVQNIKYPRMPSSGLASTSALAQHPRPYSRISLATLHSNLPKP